MFRVKLWKRMVLQTKLFFPCLIILKQLMIKSKIKLSNSICAFQRHAFCIHLFKRILKNTSTATLNSNDQKQPAEFSKFFNLTETQQYSDLWDLLPNPS